MDVVGRVCRVGLDFVRPAARVRHVFQFAVVGFDLSLHAVARTGARIAFHRSLVRAGVEQVELVIPVLVGFHCLDGLPSTIRILLAEGDFHAFDTFLTISDERVLILIPPDGTRNATDDDVRHVRPWLVACWLACRVGIIVAAQP